MTVSTFILRLHPSSFLNRLAAAFAGADADAIFQGEDEDLAVADLAAGAGAAAADDGVDRRFEKLLVDGDHQLHLAQQVHGEFVAAVDLGLSPLPPKALDVHHGQAEDFDVGQGLLDGFQPMGLNHGDNELHGGLAAPAIGSRR